MKYRDPVTREFKELYTKAADTLPVGTVVDFDGDEVPAGWEEIEETDNYSTEETFTGKYWIDGKKIYRKTYKVVDGSFPLEVDIDLSSLNYQNIWMTNAVLISVSGPIYPFPYFYSGGDLKTGWEIQTSKILQIRGSNSPYTCGTVYFTLEYTKTTDTVEESEE